LRSHALILVAVFTIGCRDTQPADASPDDTLALLSTTDGVNDGSSFAQLQGQVETEENAAVLVACFDAAEDFITRDQCLVELNRIILG